MGRPLRPDHAGLFHVVNRGVDRGAVFFDDRDRIEFERLIGLAHERFGVVVHAYCWMTNHYHLVLECPGGEMSDAMHLMGSVYVRHVNDRRGRDGPLFGSRFYARPVRSGAYLLRLVRYVHRNPLAFTAPERLLSYRWSSLRTYARSRRPQRWMRTATVSELFGCTDSVVQAALGELATQHGPIESADWADVIELAIDEHLEQVPGRRTRRTIASLLVDATEGTARAAVESLLDHPNPGARDAARYRARRRAAADPALRATVATALDLAA